MRCTGFVALFALALAPACSDDPAPQDPDGGSEDDAADDGPVGTTDDGGSSSTGDEVPTGPTFYGDVLPIFIEQCATCHQDGGIGPFDIGDYETARVLAASIAGQVEARVMPPFVADNSGDCNTFQDAGWLADDQIATIRAWADAGALEGDPATPQPPLPEIETLAGEDILVLASPDAYVPVPDEIGSNDDYQCFLVDPGITDTARYLVGHEVVPGNAAVTHHVIGFLVDPAATTPLGGTNGSLMASLDDASPDQPGWDCYGAAGNGVLVQGTPVTWAPGAGAANFPAGTGIRIEPGQVLVLQLHYNLLAGDGADRTEVRLSMADEVEREAVNALDDRFLATLFNGTAVEIPPGEESFVWKWNAALREFDSRISEWPQVELLGLLPHMHGLGHRMQVNIIRSEDDSESCGIYVDRWDFDWQRAFMYEEPILLSPFDRLEVTCEWDSTGVEGATYPGLATQNEMCLLGIYAARVD